MYIFLSYASTISKVEGNCRENPNLGRITSIRILLFRVLFIIKHSLQPSAPGPQPQRASYTYDLLLLYMHN